MLFSNFSFGFSVYVGQNFGAKNAERIKLGVRQIFLLVGGLSFFAGVLTLIFAEPLVSLYVKPNETEVIAYSLEFIRIQAWFFPFLGWIWLYNSTVKGMGKINISMVSSVVELCSKIGLSLLLPSGSAPQYLVCRADRLHSGHHPAAHLLLQRPLEKAAHRPRRRTRKGVKYNKTAKVRST